MKRALIFGVTGQDGSFLADILHAQGWDVHGMYRRVSTGNFVNIAQALQEQRLTIHRGDLTDFASLVKVVHDARPEWVFNMADQDNIDWSWSMPGMATAVTAGGVSNVIEALRIAAPEARLFQPLSITMFRAGNVKESSPIEPMSPYACAKVHAWQLCKMHRACGWDIRCGIFANHDSARRHGDYLLHKICRAAVNGEKVNTPPDTLRVDLGHAKDMMDTAVKLMSTPIKEDWVIGTEVTVSPGELLKIAEDYLGTALVRETNYSNHRPGFAQQWSADCAKLNRDIPDRARTSTRELVAEVIEKYRRKS